MRHDNVPRGGDVFHDPHESGWVSSPFMGDRGVSYTPQQPNTQPGEHAQQHWAPYDPAEYEYAQPGADIYGNRNPGLAPGAGGGQTPAAVAPSETQSSGQDNGGVGGPP